MNWNPDKPIVYELPGLGSNKIMVQSKYSDSHTFWILGADYEPDHFDVAIWRVKSLKPKP